MRKYNKKNGWYVNWETLVDENEIYALVVEGSVDIQGLVAIAKDQDMKAVYITWMTTSLDNNKLISDDVKYLGVGEHLFAIVAKMSVEYGFAADQKLLEHYIETFNGEYIGMLHAYQFAIDELPRYAKMYDYE